MTDASLFFEFCGMCNGGNEAQWCFQFITIAIASALQMAETNIAFVSVCVWEWIVSSYSLEGEPALASVAGVFRLA